MMKILVAHSPDADDFLLFWALREKKIDALGYEFCFCELDTEDLNASAFDAKFDICAISVAAYPRVAKNYSILPSGASVGRNYGPALISKKWRPMDSLKKARIAIPGKHTTAALIAKRLLPTAEFLEVPLSPYAQVFDDLKSDRVEAAVLIHEGQIAYEDRGFLKLADLGQWWHSQTALPLPLGINVIKKALGNPHLSRLTSLTTQSAIYGSEHLSQIAPELFTQTQQKRGKLSTLSEMVKYLQMYANKDSLSLPEDCKQAISALLGNECTPEYSASS